jgi:hypothetical protein
MSYDPIKQVTTIICDLQFPDSQVNDDETKSILNKLIDEGTKTPSGIVICKDNYELFKRLIDINGNLQTN